MRRHAEQHPRATRAGGEGDGGGMKKSTQNKAKIIVVEGLRCPLGAKNTKSGSPASSVSQRLHISHVQASMNPLPGRATH